MSTSKITGIIFAGIAAAVAVGAIVLTAVNSTAPSPRPWILDALGLAWMIGLWAALVAISVFLIAWVAEGMRASEATVEIHAPTSARAGGPRVEARDLGAREASGPPPGAEEEGRSSRKLASARR